MAAKPALTIRLLGTGGPELTPDRQGSATLVEANEHRLLFDAGRGLLQRLYESQVRITDVYRIFLTHLHSDHIEGLPGLWMTGWFLLGRSRPIEVWGPPGTARLVAGMKEMFSHDVEHRTSSSARDNLTDIPVTEFGEGLVYSADGVHVSAFAVQHGDGDPAFGFRIEANGKSVVLSGDTTYTENLVRHCQGADAVVLNVIAASESYLQRSPGKMHAVRKLATPEQCGEVLRRASPRLGVFTHVIKLGVTDDDIIARTRKAGYTGPLQIGSDRMVIEVADPIRVYLPGQSSLPNLTAPADLASFPPC